MKVLNYFSEAFEELKSNVTWPDWSEVQRLTIVVAVFSIGFALLTWGVDQSFSNAMERFFKIIQGK